MGSLVQPLPKDTSKDEWDAWQNQHSLEHSSLVTDTSQILGVATGQFNLTASHALTGNVQFNYIRIGNTNWLWSTKGISGNAQDVFLELSGLPPIMVPSVPIPTFGGAILNGGGQSYLSSIFINNDGTLVITGCFSLANGITGGAPLAGLCGLQAGFAFSFPTI